jgi:aspartate carbamoyltransferase catalytic subunit
MAGAPHLAAHHCRAAVINAGDGFNEHPTQGLLDIFTMQEKKGNLAGKKVLLVGDIAHSRVARSNIGGLKKLGAEVVVVGPPTLIPREIEEMGVRVSYNFDQEIENADIINMLRIQKERQEKGLFPSIEEYAKLYGLDGERIKKAKKEIIIMHPGPINRGIEITSEVADGPNNVILEQVTNGVAVRAALLFLLLGGKSGT